MTPTRRHLLAAIAATPLLGSTALAAPAFSNIRPSTIEALLIDRVSSGDLTFVARNPTMLALARAMADGMYLTRQSVTTPGAPPVFDVTKLGVRHGHYLLAERLYDGAGGKRAAQLMRDCYALAKARQSLPVAEQVTLVPQAQRNLIQQVRDGGRTILTLDHARENDWRMAHLRAGKLRPYGYLMTTNYFIVEATPAFLTEKGKAQAKRMAELRAQLGLA
ncbi:hypothetical protein CcrC1_gp447 [Caulobacter phage C1]|nr:hypothetical protein CcrC1_gp447 [Caulobacter phage C1]UTU09754.1 hypothetical protein CcrBL47_gp470 [Caulobacter phage BL47]UTU10308.1 hypothetical protein CcrRB23_gp446 [Caulobacter phage RB23]WGN97861.1 hypothetical protein [Bertelyvirus sp.]